MILIVKAVNIVLYKILRFDYCLDYAKCFSLYSSTVPEPALSTKDVEGFLCLAFAGDQSFITEMCSNFKKVFPHSPSLSSARPLKYLCRCKVRECVRKFPTLTVVLSKMMIPTSVKDYLLYLRD